MVKMVNIIPFNYGLDYERETLWSVNMKYLFGVTKFHTTNLKSFWGLKTGVCPIKKKKLIKISTNFFYCIANLKKKKTFSLILFIYFFFLSFFLSFFLLSFYFFSSILLLPVFFLFILLPSWRYFLKKNNL